MQRPTELLSTCPRDWARDSRCPPFMLEGVCQGCKKRIQLPSGHLSALERLLRSGKCFQCQAVDLASPSKFRGTMKIGLLCGFCDETFHILPWQWTDMWAKKRNGLCPSCWDLKQQAGRAPNKRPRPAINDDDDDDDDDLVNPGTAAKVLQAVEDARAAHNAPAAPGPPASSEPTQSQSTLSNG